MIREPIYARLFTFWQGLTVGGSPAFKTATRKVQHWDSVAGEDCPALLMQQRREVGKFRQGMPLAWTMHVVLFVYVRTNAQNEPTIVPSQILNPLLDAIEAAIVVDNIQAGTCTLGGLVTHCSIDGAIEIFQGNLGDEEVATIPLSILVNPF